MRILCIGGGATELQPAETVGSKAANLARMAVLGLPVPPAFVLPVELCAAIVGDAAGARQQLTTGLTAGLAFLEQATGRKFGDRRRPLLLSVRSGAARSMPGMLETVLNVGCTSAAVHGLIRMSGHPRFAWDCRRRFLESYATVVLGLERARFTGKLSEMIAAEGVNGEASLDGEALERLAGRYEEVIDNEDCAVPEIAIEQLEAAARAVYCSWTSDRARTYRQLQHLEDLSGTAVTIQAMVFGNNGFLSGAGVAFSRDPSNGAAEPVIDVLFDSQGEDVVSGSRTPETEAAIAQSLPNVAQQLRDILARLEKEFRDVQDVEFTIEDGKLWILQTRAAKRTPVANLRFAIDFVRQGLITPAEALQRIDHLDLDSLVRKRLTGAETPIARGTGASAGLAVGRAVFDAASAERLAASGEAVILVRPETSTADVAGFAAAAGILTAAGGRTAHAALVARQMGKACVVGCSALDVDVSNRCAGLDGRMLEEGDWLSVDGEAGTVYLGQCEYVVERPEPELAEVARWRRTVDAHSAPEQVGS